MGIFSAANNDFFGLDIGTSALRLVQIKKGSNQLMLQSSLAVDSKVSLSDAEEDRANMSQIIAGFVAQSGAKTKNVVLGLPSKNLYSYVIDTPIMNQQEMQKTLPVLSEQYIPVPIDNVKLDAKIIGKSPSSDNQQEVFVAAAQNSFLESRLEMIESIGLNVLAIEPDGLAIARAVMSPNIMDPVLIMDIGAFSTDIIIVQNQAPKLIRSIPTGNEAILKSMSGALNIHKDQAQQFISKFGFDDTKLEGQVANSLSHSCENLVTEVQKSIKFFSSKYPNTAISKILVTGGFVGIPKFVEFLADKLQSPTEIANSWLNVSYPQQMTDQLMAISLDFGTAVGLAEYKP